MYVMVRHVPGRISGNEGNEMRTRENMTNHWCAEDAYVFVVMTHARPRLRNSGTHHMAVNARADSATRRVPVDTQLTRQSSVEYASEHLGLELT